jgi:hypothetical protein
MVGDVVVQVGRLPVQQVLAVLPVVVVAVATGVVAVVVMVAVTVVAAMAVATPMGHPVWHLTPSSPCWQGLA